MLKEELIELVYRRLDKKYTKNELKEFYSILIDIINEKVEEETKDIKVGDKVEVSIPNLGTFVIARRGKVKIKNNSKLFSDERYLEFSERNIISFKAGKRIKESANKQS